MSKNTVASGAETTQTQDERVRLRVGERTKYSRIPHWILEADLSSGAIHLYAVLMKIADYETGTATTYLSTLAKHMKKSKSSVKAYLRELKDTGALVVTARYNGNEQTASEYGIVFDQQTPGQNTDRGQHSDLPRTEYCPPPGQHTAHRSRTIIQEPTYQEETPLPPADEPAQDELDLVVASAPPAGGGSKRKREDYPHEFEEFWAAYPKKADKRQALKAWRSARKRTDQETLYAGALRYRDDPNRDDQFTKNASTWLNADAWENGPLPARGRNKAQERLSNNLGVVQYFAEQEQAGSYWGELER